jgi:hypothetical protein
MMVRLLLGVSLLVLSCLGLSACGEAASKTQPARHASTPLVRDSDEDYDDARGGHYDLDDNPTLYYGHLASPADASAITALVRRYYTLAAAGDGRAACPLIFSVLAESLPEQYAQPYGTSSGYGSTCASVMSQVFKREHRLYAERATTLEVTSVRVDGELGLALLRFKGTPDHHLRVRREGGRWTIRQLLDEGLP